jgi:serine/threonine protein kinase
MSKKKQQYPGIFLSTTDTALPDWFSNEYPKYRNFQPMPSGGKGVLYSCEDLNLGRMVALKTLSTEAAKSPLECKRLLREARVTAQLAHPNTIPVYEIGITDTGNIFFAMKKVEGESLYEILVRIAHGDQSTEEKYPVCERINILIHAADALWYAHTHGVVHRDLKPENILVGIFDEVYLMDWGVAKVWGMPQEEPLNISATDLETHRLTITGSRPGTPLYMSPEQIRGTPPVDERSDIFSFGVLLYECLVHQEPFRGKDINETFENILRNTPPPPSTLSKQLKKVPLLDAICEKALRKHAADRYQTVGELIDALIQGRSDLLKSLSDTRSR